MAQVELKYTIPAAFMAPGSDVDVIFTYDATSPNTDGTFTVTGAFGSYKTIDSNGNVIHFDLINGVASINSYGVNNNKIDLTKDYLINDGNGVTYLINNAADSNDGTGNVNVFKQLQNRLFENGPNTNPSSSASSNPVVCFASGTLIRTARGDVAVDDLVVGDLVVTASGVHRPVRWLGHQTVDCRRHPRALAVMPVRIAAHAFGVNRPLRDLHVSPGHAICVDVVGEILIPASSLVNGATIAQVDVDTVTYWHVELDSHDVLLAEGLPAESYLDTGNRAFFAANGRPDPDAAPYTRADVCRPFHHRGPLVDAVRAQLAARAAALGWTPERDADLHLVVDGKAVRPTGSGDAALFLFPSTAKDVRLVSNTFVPAACGGTDTRRLGVRVHGLSFSGTAGTPCRVSLDDAGLAAQVHAGERENNRPWRWTLGDLALAPTLWGGLSGDVVLHLSWVASTVRGYARSHECLPVAAEEGARLHAVA